MSLLVGASSTVNIAEKAVDLVRISLSEVQPRQMQTVGGITSRLRTY